MNSKGRVASFIHKDCKILRWHLPKMLLHIRGWGRVNGPANITNVNVMISTQTKKTDILSKLIWSKISTNRTHYELVVHHIKWKWDRPICLMRLRNRRNSTKISISQNPDIVKSHRNHKIYFYVLLTFTMYILYHHPNRQCYTLHMKQFGLCLNQIDSELNTTAPK